jgi:YbbR domain-containing protein
VSRLVAILVHNWPLKVAAVLLATLLYGGLVLSQNAQRWDGRVSIVPRGQPADAVLLGFSPTNVNEIRYFAPSDVASRVDSSTFTAYADLSGVDPSAGGTFVAVHVEASDPRITIVDFQPSSVRVELDPLTVKTVPVVVDKGQAPPGVNVGEPTTSVDKVEARGPDSAVARVVSALATVRIQPSALDVDEEVRLVPVDALGKEVSDVTLDPGTVRVQIRVGTASGQKSLPVNPVVIGTPAVGFQITEVTVEPAVVTIQGDSETVASLARVDTAPLSVSAATKDVVATVDLALPPDVDPVGTDTVRVTVRIQAMAGTRTFSAGLQLSGARDDRIYALSTDRVTVVLGGPDSLLDGIDPSTFQATVPVATLPPGDHTVAVVVTNLPAGVTTVSIDPANVQVTVALPSSTSPSPSPVFPSVSPQPSP